MPDEGLISSPHPASSRLLPIKPIRRVRDVSAIAIREPTVVALVMFLRYMVMLQRSQCHVRDHDQEGYVFACFRRYIKIPSTATAKTAATILMSIVVSICCLPPFAQSPKRNFASRVQPGTQPGACYRETPKSRASQPIALT